MLYPSFPPLNSVRWRRVRACGKPCLNLSVPSLNTGTLWPILFICLSLITTTCIVSTSDMMTEEDEPVKQRRARRPKSTRQERAAEVSVSPPAISDLTCVSSPNSRFYQVFADSFSRFENSFQRDAGLRDDLGAIPANLFNEQMSHRFFHTVRQQGYTIIFSMVGAGYEARWSGVTADIHLRSHTVRPHPR